MVFLISILFSHLSTSTKHMIIWSSFSTSHGKKVSLSNVPLKYLVILLHEFMFHIVGSSMILFIRTNTQNTTSLGWSFLLERIHRIRQALYYKSNLVIQNFSLMFWIRFVFLVLFSSLRFTLIGVPARLQLLILTQNPSYIVSLVWDYSFHIEEVR